jgi:hypothetical protein
MVTSAIRGCLIARARSDCDASVTRLRRACHQRPDLAPCRTSYRPDVTHEREPQSGEQAVLHLLHPGERVEMVLDATNGELRATDRRLLMTVAGRVRMDIGYEDVRRIQFDVEAHRPATMVIVPNIANREPHVLGVPRDRLHLAGELLAFVGERRALA